MTGVLADAVEAWWDRVRERLGRPLPPRVRLGRAGERAARAHLRRRGYRVLGRNLRVPMGEADILCAAPDDEGIVLVEVKTRRVGAAGGEGSEPGTGDGAGVWTPERNVTVEKRRTLRRILAYLVRKNGWGGRATRIDVVAVEMDRRGRVVALRHHEGVC